MYKLLRRTKINYRIYFILVLFIACVIFLITAAVRYSKYQYIELEKQKTQSLVEAAKNIVGHYQQLVVTGAMTEAAAKKAATEVLKDMRPSDRAYVYIYHDLNFMIMHPFLPDQNLPDFTPEDTARSEAISQQQLEQHRVRYNLPERRRTPMEILFKYHPKIKTGFFEYVYIIDDDGLGFIAEIDDPYIPAKAPPKLGYGTYFEPWGWTILGAVYLGDLDLAVSQSVAGLIRISIIGVVIAALVSWVVSRSITKPIVVGMQRINKLIEEKKFALPQYKHGDEIYSLGLLFNGLLTQVEERDLRLRKKSFDLEQANKELLDHKQSLEKTVESRTLEYKAAKEEAERATKAKSQFLATMTHELRTPMSGVLGIVDLLEETELNKTQKEYVNIISASGEQLLDIIGDILNFEKLSANKLELDEDEFDLPNLIKELVLPFNLRLRDNSNLRFIVDIDNKCPRHVVGDALRTKQVINNFLSNAFKFTKSGEVRIKAEKVNRGGKPYITVSVHDTGIGLTEEQQENLFSDFQQADKSVARNYGGTGLGLSISKKIVELMGGTIGVKSTLNVGSTFFFDFPYRSNNTSNEKSKTDNTLEDAELNLSALHVLVAEDNAVNQMVIKGYLRKYGIDPVLAENGEIALTQALEHDFDLILMDINMPILDGVEVTAKIRAREQENNLPEISIYALTAATETNANEKYEAVGMNGVLSKPIDVNALSAALKSVAMDKQIIPTKPASNKDVKASNSSLPH